MLSTNTRLSLVDNIFLVLALVIINSLILYFFFFLDVFLVSAGIAFLISIFVYFSFRFNVKSNIRKNIINIRMTSFRDSFGLIFNHLSLQKRYLLATSIGLIITCTLIAQSAILVSSYQQYAFTDYLEGSESFAMKFDVDNVDPASIQEWIEEFDEIYPTWLTPHDLVLDNIVVYPSANFDIMVGEVTTLGSKYVDTYALSSRVLTEEYFDLFSYLPSFPANLTYDQVDSLLVLPSEMAFGLPEFGVITKRTMDYVMFENNAYSFEVLVDNPVKFGFENFNASFNNATFYSSHAWTYTKEDAVVINTRDINFPVELLSGYYVPPTRSWEAYNQLNDTAFTLFDDINQTLFEDLNITTPEQAEEIDFPFELYKYIWGTIGFEGFLNLKIPSFSTMPLDEFSLSLKGSFEVAFGDFIDSYISLTKASNFVSMPFEFYSPLEVLVDKYLKYEGNLESLMILYTIPVVLISLYLFYFAISINELRKTSYFRKMLTRGASKRNFQVLVGAEILSYGIVSPLIGFGLAVLGADVVMNYLNIVPSTNIIPVIIPASLNWRLPVLGMLLAIDFNLPNLIKATTIRYEHLSDGGTGGQLVRTNNLSLVLLVIGVGYWLLIQYVPLPGLSNRTIYQQIGLPAIFLIVALLPMVVSKYVLPLSYNLLRYMPNNLEFVSLAILNIRRHKHYTNKLMILFLISVLISFSSIISSTTIIQMNSNVTYYQLGGDIFVENISSRNQTEWNALYGNGIEGITEVSHMSYSPFDSEGQIGERDEDRIEYYFLGIDPQSFADTYLWDESFSDLDAQSFSNALQTYGAIAMHSNLANVLSLQINDTFEFKYGYRQQQSMDLTINATFNSLPRLVFEDLSDIEDEDDIDTHYIVGSLDTITDIRRNIFRLLFRGAVIKLADGADPVKITDDLYYRLNEIQKYDVVISNRVSDRVSIFSPNWEETSRSPLARFEDQFIYSSLTTTFLISASLCMIGILYFALYTYIERKREIGIYRALGMLRKQINRVMFAEVILLATMAISFAMLGALFLADKLFLSLFITQDDRVPKFEIFLNESTLLIYTAGILLISFVMASFTGSVVSRRKTASILRGQ